MIKLRNKTKKNIKMNYQNIYIKSEHIKNEEEFIDGLTGNQVADLLFFKRNGWHFKEERSEIILRKGRLHIVRKDDKTLSLFKFCCNPDETCPYCTKKVNKNNRSICTTCNLETCLQCAKDDCIVCNYKIDIGKPLQKSKKIRIN
jgi:hypothetical protein